RGCFPAISSASWSGWLHRECCRFACAAGSNISRRNDGSAREYLRGVRAAPADARETRASGRTSPRGIPSLQLHGADHGWWLQSAAHPHVSSSFHPTVRTPGPEERATAWVATP